MKSIDSIQSFSGKRVIVRVDWDVPLQDGKVVDRSRIDNSLKTIEWITQRGGSVIVISHIGHGEPISLRPAFDEFNKENKAIFIEDPFSSEGQDKIFSLKSGGVAVIENIRKWDGEKNNDPEFAKQIADLGDLYVNEAFPAAHRNHASIVGVPKLIPSFAGFSFIQEVNILSGVFSPSHPFLFILGGAKFETKIPLVERFLKIADHIFIGGALAKNAYETDLKNNEKILWPIGDMAALDGNDETIRMLSAHIREAKFILWNGPLGKYEDGYKEGTLKLAEILANSDAQVIVGGGDTLAAIQELGIKDKFYFISSAGGAMLDYLANENLPAIKALE